MFGRRIRACQARAGVIANAGCDEKWVKTPRTVPQTSQSAVSPISKSAGRGKARDRGQRGWFAGWKPCDTADWEVCGTIAVGLTHF